jgi:hypothetical protein
MLMANVANPHSDGFPARGVWQYIRAQMTARGRGRSRKPYMATALPERHRLG